MCVPIIKNIEMVNLLGDETMGTVDLKSKLLVRDVDLLTCQISLFPITLSGV